MIPLRRDTLALRPTQRKILIHQSDEAGRSIPETRAMNIVEHGDELYKQFAFYFTPRRFDADIFVVWNRDGATVHQKDISNASQVTFIRHEHERFYDLLVTSIVGRFIELKDGTL